MRYFNIFIIGFLATLIIQVGALVFLETVYFTDNISYSSTKVENNVVKKPLNSKLTLENGSKNVSASYDGNYIAYLKNNALFVLKSQDGTKIKVSANEGMKVLYYKWIYDRNRLILAEKPNDCDDETFFKLYYYDVNSKNKMEIFSETNDKGIKIQVYDSNEKIDAIDVSTLTNVIYVKLSSSDDHSRIYSINIMGDEKSIRTVTHNIGKIISTKRDDILLYESLNSKKVYRYGSKLPLKIYGNSNLSLLGIDNKDNVYLALRNESDTKTIYYGNISNNDWKKVDMKKSVNINDIYVNFKGQIFIKDSSKPIVNEILTGKKTDYSGNVINMYDNGIISNRNNELIQTIFQ